jgi:hypothetical protein
MNLTTKTVITPLRKNEADSEESEAIAVPHGETELFLAVHAIRSLDWLAHNSMDQQIENFVRAFFYEHGREARKLVDDVRRHAGDAFNGILPELGAEPFNLSDTELARRWREQ